MRFQEYIKIKDLSDSVKEACSYLNEVADVQLQEDCICAISSIIVCLEKNKKSMKTEKVMELASEILSLFEKNGDNRDYVQISNALAEFQILCDSQIERRYKLLFVADIRGKWDSMSSVYKAVAERQDCDVDVVIQPIFRTTKLPDGNVRTEVIYEDYLTERGIAHTSYKDYKLEEELPDITFISQPYESVTTQMFWPENIARYSKLVYLPYFSAVTVSSGISSARASFFEMPVQKYAWRIACQSEVMEKFYKSLASMKGKNVIVSGLPKWDEVVAPDVKFTKCPVEWEKKLAGKKVFIWNTHFSVESSSSDILKKGFNFINMFVGRKDIALIWRPHPMTEVIIKTYMPEKYPEYAKLQQIIVDSDNMVIDNNASYLPAFFCSDAMITDFSSLMYQYLFMDKPILMLVDGSVADGRRKYCTVDGLFDFKKIPFACTLEEQKDFIDMVVGGEDLGKQDRKFLIDNYFSLADGKCGERFTEEILKAYKQEIEYPETFCLSEGSVLIVGSLKDSMACIEQLKRNGDKFCFCKEFLGREGNKDYDEISLQEINKNAFGLIVITTRTNAEQVREFMLEACGLSREKVILFWQLYSCGVPIMVCDRVMQNPHRKDYDGLILGISHTEVGIVKERLKGNFCNLAVSSQDLYFQCKTLEYCVERYYDKIKGLKYAIIDLYDYHYFNYNTSYSKSAVKYLLFGGYNLEPHDFNENKLNSIPFEQVIDKLKAQKTAGISETDLLIWENKFSEIYDCANYEGFCSNYDSLTERIRMVTYEDIRGYEYNRSTITKIHKENITGNINAFQKILKILKLINPEIKIYTIIVPKYMEVEVLDAVGMKPHEEYFYSVINELQEEYGFIHLDFKKISDISYYKNLYYDAAHLNYLGALRLTDELNDIIFKE